MTPQIILQIIIILVIAEFLFDTFLEIINLNYKISPLPNEIADVYEETKYNQSIAYQKEQTIFGFWGSGLSFILSLSMLAFGGFGILHNYIISFVNNELLVSLTFFGLIFVVSDVLSLPLQLYGTFVLEEKYGFNKTTPITFITDKIKGYALGAIVGGLLVSVLIITLQWLGQDFWIVFWVFISLFMVFMNVFYTSLIVPIFNKLTPMEDGELKNKIYEYCQKVGFPLTNLFVIDGSKRSTKANAYFSGFGSKKKIVLYDTLIKDHSDDELVAVLAHEVGHYKHKHIIYSMIISVLSVGFTLFLLSKMVFNDNLSIALGADKSIIHLNLIAFGILYSPISTITGLCMSVFSRKNEYEADKYAKDTFGALPLITALKKLSANNLSNLTPHTWFVFFNYSHPTLLQRIKSLEK
jgi:STE24 endopeptidase